MIISVCNTRRRPGRSVLKSQCSSATSSKDVCWFVSCVHERESRNRNGRVSPFILYTHQSWRTAILLGWDPSLHTALLTSLSSDYYSTTCPQIGWCAVTPTTDWFYTCMQWLSLHRLLRLHSASRMPATAVHYHRCTCNTLKVHAQCTHSICYLEL